MLTEVSNRKGKCGALQGAAGGPLAGPCCTSGRGSPGPGGLQEVQASQELGRQDAGGTPLRPGTDTLET